MVLHLVGTAANEHAVPVVCWKGWETIALYVRPSHEQMSAASVPLNAECLGLPWSLQVQKDELESLRVHLAYLGRGPAKSPQRVVMQ